MLSTTADVTDEDAIRTVVERCIAEFGRLDFAIDNATDGPMPAPLAETPSEGFDAGIRTNIYGTFDGMKHVLFGFRPDALTAAQRVAVGVGGDPTAAIRAIQEGLMPYVALALVGEDQIEVGTPTDHRRIFPIDFNNEHIGDLVVGIRTGDLGLSRDDERVLTLSLPMLVQTIKAQSQAASLQRARVANASAREEERRRLRRDLHDGLGRRLESLSPQTRQGLRRIARRLPMLDRIRREAEMAINEIRELAYGLRPPALDELGLLGAIKVKIDALHGLPIDIEASDLPPLPAAVEVAAYRIVMEALTNVIRHSGATRAKVALRVGDACLTVNISDNGNAAEVSGLPASA